MATKSFTTEFKFTAKSGCKLINAIENSRKIQPHKINQNTKNIVRKDDIDKIFDSFLKG